MAFSGLGAGGGGAPLVDDPVDDRVERLHRPAEAQVSRGGDRGRRIQQVAHPVFQPRQRFAHEAAQDGADFLKGKAEGPFSEQVLAARGDDAYAIDIKCSSTRLASRRAPASPR